MASLWDRAGMTVRPEDLPAPLPPPALMLPGALEEAFLLLAVSKRGSGHVCGWAGQGGKGKRED